MATIENLKSFKPGQSGNPTGRPKIPEEVKAAFQSLTVEAVETLAKIMRTGEEHNRLKAAETILDRALGKARQAVELSGDNGGPVEMVQRIIMKAKG